MIAQKMVENRPSAARKLILVATAPRGGEDVMHLEKPSLVKYFANPSLQGYARLQKIFFTPSAASQGGGKAFIERLSLRKGALDPVSGPKVAESQIAAFREWEQFSGKRFAELGTIQQPTLVVSGVRDEMISVSNSYWLSENLPNAVLLTYPDAGHGCLFQYLESFTRQVSAFLASESASAAY